MPSLPDHCFWLAQQIRGQACRFGADWLKFMSGDCEARPRTICLWTKRSPEDLNLRFLFRLTATIALAVAVIMAVVDVTRTVAASQLVMTPLNTSWTSVSPHTLESFRQVIQAKLPVLWDPVMVTILNQPGFAVFGVLAFLLYAIGHRTRSRARRAIAGQ
jgi:hypothetical protein